MTKAITLTALMWMLALPAAAGKTRGGGHHGDGADGPVKPAERKHFKFEGHGGHAPDKGTSGPVKRKPPPTKQ